MQVKSENGQSGLKEMWLLKTLFFYLSNQIWDLALTHFYLFILFAFKDKVNNTGFRVLWCYLKETYTGQRTCSTSISDIKTTSHACGQQMGVWYGFDGTQKELMYAIYIKSVKTCSKNCSIVMCLYNTHSKKTKLCILVGKYRVHRYHRWDSQWIGES